VKVCRFIKKAMQHGSRPPSIPELTPAPALDPMSVPALTVDPTPTPTATPTPGPAGIFNPASLPTTLNHTNFGTYVGATQACDLAGKTGIANGTDHAVAFTSGGVSYQGCYSINNKLGAAPAGGAKRPAVFVFGPGLPRKSTTSAEVLNAGNQPLGIMNQGKNAGWDMIYLGMFKFSDPNNPYNFTYDQVYVDYTRAVIADLLANHKTDPARIFAFGTSAGGRIPTFMACHLADQFAAIVAQGGAVHGPKVSTSAAADRCSRPSNPVSTMYVFASGAQAPDGNPSEHYAVHVTPSHPSLISADLQDIEAIRPLQVYYSMQHVGEGWADWNGCAANLAGSSYQIVTVGVTPNDSPGTTLWRWTGCHDEAGGRSGGVDLYVMPGGHGVEPRVQDDGSAFRFLMNHWG
jgi:hypothetical protein